jgi:hypothetical protein
LGTGKSLLPGSDPVGSSNSVAHKRMGLDFFAERRMAMQAKSLLFQRFGKMHKSPLYRTKTQDVPVARPLCVLFYGAFKFDAGTSG